MNVKQLMIKIKKSRLFQASWVRGVALAVLVIVPMMIYVVVGHKVIAPINILPGCCDWSSAAIEWTADNAIPSDVVDYMLPGRYFTTSAFHQGVLPLWNPYYFGGEAYFSNSQSAVLHPINLLYAFTSVLNVQTISVLMSMALLITFTYMLLTRLGLSRVSSAVGALLYAGTPWVIFWSQWGTIVWIMAMWPLILYLLYSWRLKKYKGYGYLSVAALVVGGQVYFGHLQFSLATFMIVGLWFVFEMISSRKYIKKLIAGFLLVVVLGALFGSLAWLPSIEQASHGHRDKLQPASTVDLVRRDTHGLFSKITYDTGGTYYNEYSPPSPTMRQTELARFLLAIGIVAGVYYSRRMKLHLKDPIVFIGALAIVGLIIGWAIPPIQSIVDKTPVKGMMLHYFVAISLFALPLIAAYIYDAVDKVKLYKHIRKGYGAKILFVIGVMLFAYGMYDGYMFLTEREFATVGWVSVMLAVIAWLISPKWKKMSGVIRTMLIIMLAFHIPLFYYATVPMPDKNLFMQGNPVYSCIENDAKTNNILFPRMISALPPNTNLYYNLPVMNGYDSLFSRDAAEFIGAYNYPLASQHNALTSNAPYVVNYDKTSVAGAVGINYLIVKNGTQVPDGYVEICAGSGSTTSIYRSTTKNEAVYLASSTTKMTHDEQLESIRNNTLRAYVVEQDVIENTSFERGEIESYEIGINDISIKTDSASEQLVFVSQSYNSNWHALVDGREAKIIRADAKFMAIQLAPGRHDIKLSYMPNSVKLAGLLSIVGLLSITGLFVVDRIDPRLHRKLIKRIRRSKLVR